LAHRTHKCPSVLRCRHPLYSTLLYSALRSQILLISPGVPPDIMSINIYNCACGACVRNINAGSQLSTVQVCIILVWSRSVYCGRHLHPPGRGVLEYLHTIWLSPSKLPTSVMSTRRRNSKLSTAVVGLESMTVRELCDWLEKNGVPAEYSEKFGGSIVYFWYGTRRIMFC